MSNRLIVLTLCFFLGILGVHKFYTGRILQGIVMLLLCATGISFIWAIIDFVRYLLMSDREFDLRYGR